MDGQTRNTATPQAVAWRLPCLLACQYVHIERIAETRSSSRTWPKDGREASAARGTARA